MWEGGGWPVTCGLEAYLEVWWYSIDNPWEEDTGLLSLLPYQLQLTSWLRGSACPLGPSQFQDIFWFEDMFVSLGVLGFLFL